MKLPIKRFNGEIPAIAYTDFACVYLSYLLFGETFDLAYRHECGHIWLQHNHRTKMLMDLEGKSFNHKIWNIATDLEIAKHLYNQDDDLIINKIRSPLKGGIQYSHTEKYPDYVYAEDFYQALKDKAEEIEHKCCHLKTDKSQPIDTIEPVEELIAKAKKLNDDLVKTKQQEETQKKINLFKPPKPSLTSEIDKHLGRAKIKRVSSYRRPNRRQDDTNNDLIKKGAVNILFSPRLTLYIDRSGSFNQDKTNTATFLIETILKKYRGRIKNEVLYFNDTLIVQDPKIGQGGTNYQAVIDNIIREKAQLSIIVTDDDVYNGDIPKKLPNTIVFPVGTQKTDIASKLGLLECNK